jgi:aspartate kinase
MVIVTKFGGTSLADAEQFNKVAQIILDNPKRKVVVVSAPGKAKQKIEGLDIKVTDALLDIAAGKDAETKARYVIQRFESIATDLQIPDDNTKFLKELEQDLTQKDESFLASRGEHYSAKLMDAYLQTKGLDRKLILPEKYGFTLTDGKFGNRYSPQASKAMKKLPLNTVCVVPGFYGLMYGKNGDQIATLGRGGSDITGGEIAAAIGAQLYENWTDQPGVKAADPRIIQNAPTIPELTYDEMRVLGVRGFGVLHFEAMLACEVHKIPILVGNTNDPHGAKTRIMEDRLPNEQVIGVSKLDNLAYVTIQKRMMDEETGFTEKALSVFSKAGIPTDLYSASVDELAIFMPEKELKGKMPLDVLTRQLREKLGTENVYWNNDVAIVTIVGKGMKNSIGVIAKSATALSNEGINIITTGNAIRGSGIYYGVRQAVANTAVETLYNAFIENKK